MPDPCCPGCALRDEIVDRQAAGWIALPEDRPYRWWNGDIENPVYDDMTPAEAAYFAQREARRESVL